MSGVAVQQVKTSILAWKLLSKESTIKTRQNRTKKKKKITKPCRNHFCRVFVSLKVDNHELISDYGIYLVIFSLEFGVHMVIITSVTVCGFFSGLCYYITYESLHLSGSLMKSSLDIYIGKK